MLLVCSALAGNIEVYLDSVPHRPLRPCSITVRAVPPQLCDSVRLSYRMGGDPAGAHQCEAAAVTDSTVLFVVPAPFATPRGLGIQVSARDRTTDTIIGPIDIPVLVPQRRAPDTCAYDQWRLLSLPLVPRHTAIAALLCDDLGSPDATKWRAFEWDTDSSRYLELAADDSLRPGEAFWLRSRVPRALLDIDTATTVPVSAPLGLTLRPGWNAIANPYLFAVDWQAILGSTPDHQNQIDGPYWWNGTAWENPLDHPALIPWQGYYVRNELPNPLQLYLPPVESETAPPFLYRARSDSCWRMRIAVVQGGSRDANDIIGKASAAVCHPEPPPGPDGSALRGALIVDADTAMPCMTDIRAAECRSPRWRYIVRHQRSGMPVCVSVALLSGSPARTGGLVLVDSTDGRAVDMEQTQSYTYVPLTDEPRRELWFVSGDSARFAAPAVRSGVSAGAALQVMPAGCATVAIRYDIPDRGTAEAATVGIYSLGGELVRALVGGMRGPGLHTMVWDCRDHAGRRVPAAVYLCRLRSGRGATHATSFALTRQ